jgi:O-antigen/teichoic acid export membrane protein
MLHMNRPRTPASVGWNLAGVALPGFATLIAVPLLVRQLGNERYGLLAYCLLTTSYFLLFDFGLARALTRFASERLGAGRREDLPGLFATCMAMMTRLAIVGAVVQGVLSWILVYQLLSIDSSDRLEALWSFWIASASLPFVIVSGAWRAVLEALGRFDLTNRLQIPIGTALALAPPIALVVVDSLVAATAFLLAIQVAGCLAYRSVTLKVVPALRHASPDRARWRRLLLRFGGWATVSNTVGPLMVNLDRFLIGGAISLSALTYYTTSYELVTRTSVIAGATVNVLFPALSAMLVSHPIGAGASYRRGFTVVLALVLPPLTVLSFFAPEILQLWLGTPFSVNGSAVLRILAGGVLVNCLALVSAAVLQAGGHTDWIAKLHMAELVPYFGVLAWLVVPFGITGIAIAWTLRVTVDAIVLTWAANRLLPGSRKHLPAYMLTLCAAPAVFGLVSTIESTAIRALTSTAVIIVCAMLIVRARHESEIREDRASLP